MSTMTDDEVIGRLRAALDEVAAGVGDRVGDGDHVGVGDSGAVAAVVPMRRRSPAVVIGAAAATVAVVAGGVWAISSRDTDDPTVPAAAPSTSAAPSTTLPATDEGPWFAMDVATLSAGDDSGWLRTADADVRSVWTTSDGTGLLMLLATSREPPPDDALDEREIDGQLVYVTGVGVDVPALADQVVSGSGLPFVLPDPSVTLLGFTTPGEVTSRAQRYDGDAGSVTIRVSDRADGFDAIALADLASVAPVTVAGRSGIRLVRADGTTVVAWQEDQHWVFVSIDAGLSASVDDLLTAITQVELASPPPITADGAAAALTALAKVAPGPTAADTYALRADAIALADVIGDPVSATGDVTVVFASGEFTCPGCSMPAGSDAPTGQFAYTILDHAGRPVAFGLNPTDLAPALIDRFGAPLRLDDLLG